MLGLRPALLTLCARARVRVGAQEFQGAEDNVDFEAADIAALTISRGQEAYARRAEVRARGVWMHWHWRMHYCICGGAQIPGMLMPSELKDDDDL